MILYLHGLNSGSGSAKAGFLRRHLPDVEIRVPDYPAHRAADAVSILEASVAPLAGPGLMVIGSSMGGFYGRYLCGRFAVGHLVMINPALAPWRLLPAYKGPQTNPLTGESYLLTDALIDETRRFDAAADSVARTPTTLFLDRGDEVIDARRALDLYRDHGEIHLYDGGSHGFDHMSQAVARIREIHRDLLGRL